MDAPTRQEEVEKKSIIGKPLQDARLQGLYVLSDVFGSMTWALPNHTRKYADWWILGVIRKGKRLDHLADVHSGCPSRCRT